MQFDISMGMRRHEPDFKAKIDEILARDHNSIATILAEYSVPRTDAETER